SSAGGMEADEVRAFCTAMLGHEGPYLARPLVSCWAFAGGHLPSGATLYAPIAYYVQDDGEACDRIRRWLGTAGIDPAGYQRAIAACGGRPLGAGVGMHSYVSFKRDGVQDSAGASPAAERGAPRLTAYLAPEAYRTFPPAALARRVMPAPHRSRIPEQL